MRERSRKLVRQFRRKFPQIREKSAKKLDPSFLADGNACPGEKREERWGKRLPERQSLEAAGWLLGLLLSTEAIINQ